MPGGLAIAAASSAAWAVMGAQAEIALNSGWVLDQRQDGAGGFITNASPTSSGFTFVSTGDATALYLVGRAIRVVQTGTAVCVVGQSSFAGGITTIYVNQSVGFSTAVGLSTAATTGAITSIAASPIIPGSSGQNTFGPFVITASTGGSPWYAMGLNTPPTATILLETLGSLAMRGASNIVMRNATNDANVLINNVGGAATAVLSINANTAIGAGTVASSGVMRLPNSSIAIVSKTSTGGDDIVWPIQFQSTTLATQIFSSGAGGTNIFSKTLAVGTWWVSAGLTVQDTGNANVGCMIAINNGTTDLFTQQTAFNQIIGTTGPSGSLSISGIVSHTTALTYNIVLFGPTTTLKAVPAGGGWSGFGGSTAASWFNAVKIG